MGKKKRDIDFYLNLILRCLDYVPPVATDDHPKIKTLKSLQSAVNLVRTERYSWLLLLVSRIPETDYTANRLMNHIRCVDFSKVVGSGDDGDDELRYEEFLTSCALAVQFVHSVAMRHRCFKHVETAAEALEKVFFKKYRRRFAEISWDGFESYCEARLLRRGSSLVRCIVEPGRYFRNTGSDIFWFWSMEELKVLYDASVGLVEGEQERGWSTPASVFSLCYLNHVKGAMAKFVDAAAVGVPSPKSRGFVSKHPDCPGAKGGFCLGCVMTVSCLSPEEEEEESREESEGAVETSSGTTEKGNLRVDEDPIDSDKYEDASTREVDLLKVNYRDSSITIIITETSSEDLLPTSLIKKLKCIFKFGITALGKSLVYWFTLLKDVLKSRLVKLLFYVLRVFGLPSKKKVSPPNCHPVAKEHALILEDDSTENKESFTPITVFTTLNPVLEHTSTPADVYKESKQNPETLFHVSEHSSTLDGHSLTLKGDSSESKERIPTLNPVSGHTSTIGDDCSENKQNPEILDHVSEEHSSTLEGNSLTLKTLIPLDSYSAENNERLPILDSVLETHDSTLEGYSFESKENLPSLVYSTLKDDSTESIESSENFLEPCQEELTRRLYSNIEFLDLMILSLDKDDNPLAFGDPKTSGRILDFVQSHLDWTHGTRRFKDYFNKCGKAPVWIECCKFCKWQCKTNFFELLDKYKKEFQPGEESPSDIISQTI